MEIFSLFRSQTMGYGRWWAVSSSIFHEAAETLNQMVQLVYLTQDEVPEEHFYEVNSGYALEEQQGVESRAKEHRRQCLVTLSTWERAIHKESCMSTRRSHSGRLSQFLKLLE